jgi:hypothetical protein
VRLIIITDPRRRGYRPVKRPAANGSLDTVSTQSRCHFSVYGVRRTSSGLDPFPRSPGAGGGFSEVLLKVWTGLRGLGPVCKYTVQLTSVGWVKPSRFLRLFSGDMRMNIGLVSHGRKCFHLQEWNAVTCAPASALDRGRKCTSFSQSMSTPALSTFVHTLYQ